MYFDFEIERLIILLGDNYECFIYESFSNATDCGYRQVLLVVVFFCISVM